MESVVTPDMAQLSYDPWLVQAVHSNTQITMGIMGLVAFMLVAIILMQIWIVNQKDKHEGKDAESVL